MAFIQDVRESACLAFVPGIVIFRVANCREKCTLEADVGEIGEKGEKGRTAWREQTLLPTRWLRLYRHQNRGRAAAAGKPSGWSRTLRAMHP